MFTNNRRDDTETIAVPPSALGTRLDQFLVERYPYESRSYFQRLVERGLVLVNGVQVKKGVRLRQHDEIEVEFALTPELSLEPEAIPLDIVYEDDWIIVVNKPVGLVVHPGIGNWSGTFVNGLLHYCNQLPAGTDPWRPGIVHRLDKDTSGLLIAAKQERAQTQLVTLFAQRAIYKEYIAVCVGNPTNGVIDTPIARHPQDRKKFTVVPEGGKEARTHVKSVGSDGRIALVKLVLETGRTHQIRVHLLSIGHPVLGDTTYGYSSWNQKYKAERQLLHARKVAFDHPITGKHLEIIAPIPQDMERYACLDPTS